MKDQEAAVAKEFWQAIEDKNTDLYRSIAMANPDLIEVILRYPNRPQKLDGKYYRLVLSFLAPLTPAGSTARHAVCSELVNHLSCFRSSPKDGQESS